MYTLMLVALIFNMLMAIAVINVNLGTAILNMCSAVFCAIYLTIEHSNEEDSND